MPSSLHAILQSSPGCWRSLKSMIFVLPLLFWTAIKLSSWSLMKEPDRLHTKDQLLPASTTQDASSVKKNTTYINSTVKLIDINSRLRPWPSSNQLAKNTGRDQNTASFTLSPQQPLQLSCMYSPYDYDPCITLLRQRLPALPIRKMFVFGDSTMFRLVNSTNLRAALVDTPRNTTCPWCPLRTTDYCNLTYGVHDHHDNTTFLPVSQYRKPHYAQEGPATTGWNNPGCSDCGGCESRFLDCSCHQSVLHGGFVHMEFARDVEWQTQHFATTQENTAHFVLHDQQAICVMGVGFHDMVIPQMTLPRFLSNVQWYLQVFLRDSAACRHVVWITNNAPGPETEFIQTRENTLEWNEAVRTMVATNPELASVVTIVDVYEASQEAHHCDHLHLNKIWYDALADMFLVL